MFHTLLKTPCKVSCFKVWQEQGCGDVRVTSLHKPSMCLSTVVARS